MSTNDQNIDRVYIVLRPVMMHNAESIVFRLLKKTTKKKTTSHLQNLAKGANKVDHLQT